MKVDPKYLITIKDLAEKLDELESGRIGKHVFSRWIQDRISRYRRLSTKREIELFESGHYGNEENPHEKLQEFAREVDTRGFYASEIQALLDLLQQLETFVPDVLIPADPKLENGAGNSHPRIQWMGKKLELVQVFQILAPNLNTTRTAFLSHFMDKNGKDIEGDGGDSLAKAKSLLRADMRAKLEKIQPERD